MKSFNGVSVMIVTKANLDIYITLAIRRFFNKALSNSFPWSILIVAGAPYRLIQLVMIPFTNDRADLSGRGTAATNLENWSSIDKIYLFLLLDIVIGPTRSMHTTLMTLILLPSCGSTCLRFTSSLCRHPGHSVTKIAVSARQSGQ